MNQTIGVNITPQSFQPTLHYSQGDVGRVFVVNVTDYDIPSGATVTCVATKPSGMGFTVSGTVTGNSVTFTSTAEMTDEWGRFPAEIRIASGNTLLGTANFLMIGEKDPHPASTIDGTQEELIPQLTLLVNRVEAAAESVHDLTVSATTLTAGSDATATYDSANNSIAFGIPRGADGDVTRSEFNDLKSEIDQQSYNGLCGVDSVNTNNKLYAYIDTSSQKVIEDFENHSSQSVWFKCFPNTVYRITKDVGSVFRICTTTQKPAHNVSYNQTSANHTGTEIDVITGDNDNYILVYYYQGAESSAQEEMLNSISAIYGGTNLPQFLESAKDYVTYTESDMEYEGEYINPSGGISSNANFLRTNAIPIADGANYVLITDSSTIEGGCAVAFYTSGTISTSNFISGVPIVYAEDVPLIVHIPTNATHYAFSTRKANTFIAKTDSFTYKWDENHNEPASADAIEYLAGIASSDFVGKNFHFSFDDVTSCLIDLRDNTYTDIFTQHPFFTFLKNMHDTYGAVFTLNVISSIPEISFTIAGIGTGYQSQFSGKSNWLRFSYHGYTSADDYRTSTNMQAGYNAFVNGIYTLTGSYSFVDRFVRLPSFYGTKENCLICKSLNYGAIGFLSADDTRISYYFTQAENDRLVKNGKFFDSSTQLSFIRSMTRLENVTAQQMEAEIESNIHYSKLVEVFMHEQNYKAHTETMQGRISTLLLWAKDNGFKFAYPSDIYA